MRVDTLTDEYKVIKLEKYLKRTNYRDYVIFKIGTNLGLRVSDFLDKPVKSKKELEASGELPYYSVGYFRDMCKKGRVRVTQEKTDKEAYFEIPTEIKELILEYTDGKADGDIMFPSRKGGKALTRVGFFLSLKDACESVGITENIGCHSMRKIFGYYHYKKYKDIRLLMEIFNHSDEKVTLRYIGVSQEKIDISMRNFSVGSFDRGEDERETEEMLELKKRMLEERKKKKENKKVVPKYEG